MALYPKLRDVHLYVGLATLIPLVIIAGAGIAMNHKELLKLEREDVKERQGRPSSQDDSSRDRSLASTPTLTSTPGTWAAYAVAVDLALAAAAETWGEMPLDKIELKDEPGYGLIVKVKAAKGSRVSPEEIVWSVAENRVVHKSKYKKEGNNPGTDWKKVITDLHTGRLLSERYGFWWSDLSAMAMLLLAGTGIVLYAIPLYKKRKRKKTVRT